MLNTLGIYLSSLREFAKKLISRFKSSTMCRSWKKAKPRRLVSDLSWLTSSFAAMEVSNQFRQVFKFIDANGDGKISPLELSEVLLSLGHEKSVARKEAEGMVREMDCDGDGFVDLDEFMSVMINTDDNEAISKEDDLMEAFLVFDADRNGVISAKELQHVLISLGCGKCSLRECHRMIQSVDKDGDGFVNFEEFKSMMTLGCNTK